MPQVPMSTWFFGQGFEYHGCIQLLERQYFRWNGSKNCCWPALLVESIDTKTCHIGYFERKVYFQKFFKIFLLLIIHNVVNHRVDGLGIQRIDINTANFTVYTDHGRQSR